MSEIKEELENCPDCSAEPGRPHNKGCDIEHCSVCGLQRLSCNCEGHDPLFSRWTGVWPAEMECFYLGLTDEKGEHPDLNRFYQEGLHEIFFVKPKP